jgi:hypothetical protein
MRFQLHATKWSEVGRNPGERKYLESIGVEFGRNGPVVTKADGTPFRLVIELFTLEDLMEFTETIDEECIVRAGYIEIYNG